MKWKQKVEKLLNELAYNNLISGDASNDYKLLRTGYACAIKNVRDGLKKI